MIEIEDDILVGFPCRRVFQVASRPENMPLWNRAVLESRAVGALKEGAKVVQLVQLFGHRFETLYEVTCYQPLRKVSYTSTTGPMDVRGTMEFRPRRGSTLVRWMVAVDHRGIAGVADSFLVRAGRREMRACLENLRRLVEEMARGPAIR